MNTPEEVQKVQPETVMQVVLNSLAVPIDSLDQNYEARASPAGRYPWLMSA